MVRIVMIASRSHRSGPDSRLIRFVREFSPFLNSQQVCAIAGTYFSIRQNGLLRNLEKLPSGRAGGLVHVTQKVVDDELDVVIHLMDPRDPTSIYPEANALKRECIAKRKLFLSTYMSAVEWASLVWRDDDDLLRTEGRNAKMLSAERIALISHDELKVQMLKFALLDHLKLLGKFREIVATGTTGNLLNDPVSRVRLKAEWERKLRQAQEEDHKSEIERLSQELAILEKILSTQPALIVTRKESGPRGGDVQIAHEVLKGSIQKVIFFEDPYTARPHEPDIQLLERTCRVAGEGAVCLSDPVSADQWASAWRIDSGDYFDQAPITVLRALEQKYGSEGHRLRVVLAPTANDHDGTMSSICETTAYYLRSLIERLWIDKCLINEAVQIAIPWGDTIRKLIDAFKVISGEADSLARPRPSSPPAVSIMPMVGLIGTESPLWEANVLAERFAEVFGPEGEHHNIPGLAFVTRSSELPAKVRAEVARLAKTDIAILIGAPIRPPQGDEAKTPIWPAVIDAAKRSGSVGEISGLFVDQAGKEVKLVSYKRVGLDFDGLRDIASDRRRRVVLVIGSHPSYLPLARALLGTGVVSTVITDQRFGRWLLGAGEQPPEQV